MVTSLRPLFTKCVQKMITFSTGRFFSLSLLCASAIVAFHACCRQNAWKMCTAHARIETDFRWFWLLQKTNHCIPCQLYDLTNYFCLKIVFRDRYAYMCRACECETMTECEWFVRLCAMLWLWLRYCYNIMHVWIDFLVVGCRKSPEHAKKNNRCSKCDRLDVDAMNYYISISNYGGFFSFVEDVRIWGNLRNRQLSFIIPFIHKRTMRFTIWNHHFCACQPPPSSQTTLPGPLLFATAEVHNPFDLNDHFT